MNKYLSLVLLLLCFTIFAQKKSNDQIVGEAGKYYKEGNFAAVLETIKNADKSDQRIQFLLIKSKCELQKDDFSDDFSRIITLKNEARTYLNTHSVNKNEIQACLAGLEEEFPFDSQEEYEIYLAEQEKLKIEQEKLEIGEQLTNSLLAKKYSEVLKTLAEPRINLLLAQLDKNFYRVMAKYGEFTNKTDYEFNDYQSIRAQLLDFKDQNGNQNADYLTAVNYAYAALTANYPSTLEEFQVKREELKRKKLELELQAKLADIKKNFNDSYYSTVIQKANGYPAGNESSGEVDYYKSLSQYFIFMENADQSFDDITVIKQNLKTYLANKTYDSAIFRNDLESKLTYIETTYPKTLTEFNAKKEQERLKIAKKAQDEQKEVKKQERKLSFSRKMKENFFAIGYEGGTIANYGLRFEVGGDRLIGFFLNARTSLAKDADVLSGAIVDNKNEAVGGPSIKIAKWMLLNIGGGYGFHKFAARNDYASTMNLETKEYVVGYGGVTFRLGNRVNILGGASFIDITEDFYAPEYTFGLTINLK